MRSKRNGHLCHTHRDRKRARTAYRRTPNTILGWTERGREKNGEKSVKKREKQKKKNEHFKMPFKVKKKSTVPWRAVVYGIAP